LRQNEGYQKFLWAAAGAAIFHCRKYLVMWQLMNDESMDPVGNNLLQVAAFSGDEQVVRILLRDGMDVNNCHIYFGRALYGAVFKGHTIIARLLLDAGAKIRGGAHYRTALHIAALEGHESIVRLLIERGACISASYNAMGDGSPLDEAVRGEHAGVVRILLEAGAEVNLRGGWDIMPLHRAAHDGNEAVVRVLLEGGAEVSAMDRCHNTPLNYAVSFGRQAVASLLVSAGAGYASESSDSEEEGSADS
jgi:ankyrin repeat protein